MAMATAVAALAGGAPLRDAPNNYLRLLTLNIGSLAKRQCELMVLLVMYKPQLCFLQECQARHGQFLAIGSELAAIGYFVCPGVDGLCTIFRDGLNAAPIALTEADKGF